MNKHKKGPAGVAGEWLVAHVGYDGDGCLTWPYGCDLQGYGHVAYDGKIRGAARVMCTLVNGPPPTPRHHAAHSCGMGHKACVHPKHVEWKTPTDNQLDRAKHGTGNKPGRPGRKLTADQVAAIKALKGQKTQREIGAEFGIRWETVGQIHRGVIYADRPKRYGRTTTPSERRVMATRATELRAGGKTFEEIANEIGVNRVTARRYIQGFV